MERMVKLIGRKGQNTLEYVIILTALVVAFIAGTTAVKNALYSSETAPVTDDEGNPVTDDDGNPVEVTTTSGLIGTAADRIPAWTGKLPGATQ